MAIDSDNPVILLPQIVFCLKSNKSGSLSYNSHWGLRSPFKVDGETLSFIL